MRREIDVVKAPHKPIITRASLDLNRGQRPQDVLNIDCYQQNHGRLERGAKRDSFRIILHHRSKPAKLWPARFDGRFSSCCKFLPLTFSLVKRAIDREMWSIRFLGRFPGDSVAQVVQFFFRDEAFDALINGRTARPAMDGREDAKKELERSSCRPMNFFARNAAKHLM